MDSSTDFSDISLNSIFGSNVESENDSITNGCDLGQENDASGVVQTTGSACGEVSTSASPCGVVTTNDSADCVNAKKSCDECNEKALEAQEWEKKYKDLKRVYVKLNIRFSEIEMKYNDLLKTVTPTVHSDTDALLSSDDVFTLKEIKVLKSIPLDKEKDSTFILQGIKFAYKENRSDLLSRTLKGKPEWTNVKQDGSEEHHPAKSPLTPEKVTRITELFIERVSACKTSSADFGERIHQTNINRLFASGVNNANKTQKSKEADNLGLIL